MSWLLDQEILQKCIGYLIIIFQFSFLFFHQIPRLRPLYFLIGIGLHLGITLSFNIYPFGLGMLIFYSLVMPFSWYRRLGAWIRVKQPLLTVFYDQQCPLCCRTVLILNHFDICHSVDFKPAQQWAMHYPALNEINETQLLSDLYALDNQDRLYAGVGTYAQILIAMRYPAVLGLILKLPLISSFAEWRYRKIADNRRRLNCDISCLPETPIACETSLYDKIFNLENSAAAKVNSHKLTKVLIILILFQLNSSLHYGLLYRLHVDTRQTSFGKAFSNMSNAVLMFSHTFLGITPHALYLHDHFTGYNHLLAINYLDADGKELPLPFVDQQGRLLAPNWGRVHSMWANIAVTPTIDELRLKKFIMKVTAFWGKQLGLNLDTTHFVIKLKKIEAPFTWEPGLRNKNLSGEWQTIGEANWEGKVFKINIPDQIDQL